MKPEIHPAYKEIKVVCSCGSTFETRSTLDREQLLLEVCSKCHPFYTGTQKIIDTAGRVDRFRQKYGMKAKEAKPEEAKPVEVKAAQPAEAKAEPAKKEAVKKEAAPKKETTKAPKKEASKKEDAKKTDK